MDSQKLSTKTKVCYAVSEAGMLIVSYTLATQLMFFMTDFLGIATAAAGTMFLVARIWDAVNNPMMGIVTERSYARWGKYRPWLLIGGIPLALSLFLNLNNVHFAGQGNLIYMYAAYILFGMAYTVAFIPYTTMLSNLARTPEDRASLSSIKGGFQGVGVLVASVLTVPLLQFFGNGQITADGFGKVGLIYGALALALFCVTFFMVKERPAQAATPPKYTVKLLLRLIFKNRNLMLVVLMYFFMYLRIFLSNGAAMYFFTYSRGDMSIMPAYMAISSIVNIAAALLAPRLAKRFGKRWLTIASAAVCVAAYGGLYAARTAGVAVFLTMAMITWLSGSVPYALIWAFVADITDETERREGFRADGILYSVTSFANKFSGAISGFVSGAVLGATGYAANQAQSPLALFGIDVTMFILPAVCMVGVVIAMLLYRPEKKSGG